MSQLKGFIAETAMGIKDDVIEAKDGHYEISLGAFGPGRSRNGVCYTSDLGERLKHILANRILNGTPVVVSWPPSLNRASEPMDVAPQNVLALMVDIKTRQLGEADTELLGSIRPVGDRLGKLMAADSRRRFSVYVRRSGCDWRELDVGGIVMDNLPDL